MSKKNAMGEPNLPLLKANLKQLRLPTILAECEKLAREAAESNQPYEEYLLRLTEMEVSRRSANSATRASQTHAAASWGVSSVSLSRIANASARRPEPE